MLLLHLRAELPDAIIVSLGQRPAPPAIHGRQLVLERSGDAAILKPAAAPAMAAAR